MPVVTLLLKTVCTKILAFGIANFILQYDYVSGLQNLHRIIEQEYFLLRALSLFVLNSSQQKYLSVIL